MTFNYVYVGDPENSIVVHLCVTYNLYDTITIDQILYNIIRIHHNSNRPYSEVHRFTLNSSIMNIVVSVVYAFLLGTALDIGRTMGTAVAAATVYADLTEPAATAEGVKSAKRTKNSPQQLQQELPSEPLLTRELAVQDGVDCSILQRAYSSGHHYTLRATMGTETVLFSERPIRTAQTLPTQAFVKKFKDLLCQRLREQVRMVVLLLGSTTQ